MVQGHEDVRMVCGDRNRKKKQGDVGILTFHCAENFGAMLQAYGLKTYLGKKGIAADIVPYEPPFMTGRHWWIPYTPLGSIRRDLIYSWHGWRKNLRMKTSFFVRKANMKRFRTNYLMPGGTRKIICLKQFTKLTYPCYIVGSDQIWNPDITCGLRKAYFGAFESREKKKIIAYAASMGSASPPDKYAPRFSELIQHVNAVSVRERAAIPYVKQFYAGEVCAALDPVFLPERNVWQEIEKTPPMERYIFVYITEHNEKLMQYVRELSKRKDLPVVRIGGGAEADADHMIIDTTAGPAEFLGYLHKADYVVTNSFHGAAFSIIFQKKFMVFQHSSTGERLYNILSLHGLEDRIVQEDKEIDIDCDIAWRQVRECTETHVKEAERFLLNHIR